MAQDWNDALEHFEWAMDLPLDAQTALLDGIGRDNIALAQPVRSLLAAHQSRADALIASRLQAGLATPPESIEEFSGFSAGCRIGPRRWWHHRTWHAEIELVRRGQPERNTVLARAALAGFQFLRIPHDEQLVLAR